MELYGQVLAIAIPFFFILIAIEKAYGWYIGQDLMPVIDAVSSILSGITNTLKEVLGLSITIISYDWMVDHLALMHLSESWVNYVIAFVVIDFHGYWSHRWQHGVNILWNRHIIHHSSQEFNLPCALRQSISGWFSIFTFLLIPAALVGVPSNIISLVLPLHLFMQFWYHTRHIDKLGWLEKIIVTPSHHRVHHAINPIYLDKNHSQILIIWDKLFGTFQEELDSEPPVYGVTRPVNTWNPFKINYIHLYSLIRDALYSRSIKDALMIWWRPTGWRPAVAEQKLPMPKIDDIYHIDKYRSPDLPYLQHWAVLQLLVMTALLLLMLLNISAMELSDMFWYAGFMAVGIYSITDTFDASPSALVSHLVYFSLGLYLMISYQGWFGLGQIYTYSIGMYLLFDILTAAYLYWASININRSLS